MLDARLFAVTAWGALLVAVSAGAVDHWLHGVVMISNNAGIQVYDPFNTPHAVGNLSLGMDTTRARPYAAVVVTPHLFLASARRSCFPLSVSAITLTLCSYHWAPTPKQLFFA
jgi:hypothetical protein